MADWPDADELKRVLNIDSDDWDTTVDRVLAAAINTVKDDVGNWSEDDDEPDDMLAQAALRMGELISVRPTTQLESRRGRDMALSTLSNDPTYRSLLKGHRRAFGVT